MSKAETQPIKEYKQTSCTDRPNMTRLDSDCVEIGIRCPVNLPLQRIYSQNSEKMKFEANHNSPGETTVGHDLLKRSMSLKRGGEQKKSAANIPINNALSELLQEWGKHKDEAMSISNQNLRIEIIGQPTNTKKLDSESLNVGTPLDHDDDSPAITNSILDIIAEDKEQEVAVSTIDNEPVLQNQFQTDDASSSLLGVDGTGGDS